MVGSSSWLDQFFSIIINTLARPARPTGSRRENICTLFECQCIQNESNDWGHHFYVSCWRRDCHFTWSSEPREGQAACSAKRVPSFLRYFKTLSIGPGSENRTRDLPLCSHTLYRLSYSVADLRVVRVVRSNPLN